MSSRVYTTYEAARICDVHHTTIINWVNDSRLKAYTTPGNHRRIKKEDLLDFMKEYGMPIPMGLNKDLKKILIVEDDTEAVNEYLEALSGLGCEIDFAFDGFGAGRKIYKENPDLILLDFKMPGVDGFQVCEFLHKDEETVNIPIIALTVLKSDADIKRIKSYGVKAYMPKPVDMEKLIKLIKMMLQVESHADARR